MKSLIWAAVPDPDPSLQAAAAGADAAGADAAAARGGLDAAGWDAGAAVEPLLEQAARARAAVATSTPRRNRVVIGSSPVWARAREGGCAARVSCRRYARLQRPGFACRAAPSTGDYRGTVIRTVSLDDATTRRLERHETMAHAIPSRDVRDLGDALVLHDPRDPDPFWNRMVSVRWPASPDAFDRRLDEAVTMFALDARQPHIWPSPAHSAPAGPRGRGSSRTGSATSAAGT